MNRSSEGFSEWNRTINRGYKIEFSRRFFYKCLIKFYNILHAFRVIISSKTGQYLAFIILSLEKFISKAFFRIYKESTSYYR